MTKVRPTARMIIWAEFMRMLIMLLTVRKVPGLATRPKIRMSTSSSPMTKAMEDPRKAWRGVLSFCAVLETPLAWRMSSMLFSFVFFSSGF